MSSNSRVTKRCSKACERCRSMKVKCSGTQPCSRCGRRKKPCIYPVEDKRVSIPESYLHELESRSNRTSTLLPLVGLGDELPDRPSSSSHDDGAPGFDEGAVELGEELTFQTSQRSVDRIPSEAPPETNNVMESDAVSSEFRQNPLVDNDYTFARAKGKYWYMGPSSSWSFCRRVLALLGKRIPEQCQNPDPWHLDGMAFKMQWQPLGRDETPDTSNLPPMDYALYLYNTVKFYLGVLFYLIDDDSFMKELREFYQDPVAKANQSRLWYAQYLLILAFGKAIINKSGGRDTPPGYQYAEKAMSMMPDLSGMDDAHQAIQALALASLYLQSVDMRMAAFHHIGQALRTCIIEGIHRHLPEAVVGEEFSKRSGIIFWVVYMLERDFSAQIGGPSSIRDEDITVKLPSHLDQGVEAWNMRLHVQLSRLMTKILRTVYGVGKGFEESLVKNTQSILRDLAEISGNLTEFLNTHFQGSVNKASRIALRLVLSYHHCVVMTTRPLVMCALHVHIEHTQGGDRNSKITLAPPVSSLIHSCVDSAQTILRTLQVLGDEDLLESFLPFQLEEAFSSAFVLQIVRTMDPSLIQDESWKHNTEKILDRMIAQGSLVAPLRKTELTELERTMVCMTPKEGRPPTPSPSQNDQALQIFQDNGLDAVHFGAEPGWDVFDVDGGMGLSPRVLLDLAEQLDVDFLINSVGV